MTDEEVKACIAEMTDKERKAMKSILVMPLLEATKLYQRGELGSRELLAVCRATYNTLLLFGSEHDDDRIIILGEVLAVAEKDEDAKIH